MPETPHTALYGGSDQPPASKAPSLIEQLTGVFTGPGALFDKLRATPAWVPAVLLTVVLALAVTVVWGLKVDVDAMMRPVLERNPKVTAEQIDTIIQVQSKLFLPLGILGSLAAPWAATALIAFFYWLMGRGFAEEGKPSYRQALSAAAVAGLVMAPHSLLTLLMALVKPVGGLSPEKLPPTSLGFFLSPEGPKLQALLYRLDIFLLGSLLVGFIACRRLLRLSTLGAALATGFLALLAIGLPVFFAR